MRSRLLSLIPDRQFVPSRAVSYSVGVRTLHGRCHGVEDLEGIADIRTNSGDVLLLPAHVAILRTTGLWRQDTHTRTNKLSCLRK